MCSRGGSFLDFLVVWGGSISCFTQLPPPLSASLIGFEPFSTVPQVCTSTEVLVSSDLLLSFEGDLRAGYLYPSRTRFQQDHHDRFGRPGHHVQNQGIFVPRRNSLCKWSTGLLLDPLSPQLFPALSSLSITYFSSCSHLVDRSYES